MAISQSRYINITSGVAGASIAAQRQLIGRIITPSSSIPAGTNVEFSTLISVGQTFGTSSEEYLRAAQYFGYVSKQITSPQKISFYGWASTGAAPQIIGGAISSSLAYFQAITDGELIFNVGSTPVTISAIDLSAITDFTDLASTLKAAINASTEAQLATANVTFSGGSNSLTLTGAVIADTTITTTADTGGLALALGWLTPEAQFIAGVLAQSAKDAINDSASKSDNFATFLFSGGALSLSDITEVATWNHAQNNFYMYCVPVSIANASSYSAALIGFSGLALTAISDTQAGYPEQLPMQIAAATDYSGLGIASQNYMFQSDSVITASVSTDTLADTLDALRVNYIGQTQSAGVYYSFYQRGVLMGGATAALDQNVYVNEIWVKSSISAAIMNSLLSGSLPANPAGTGALLGVIQSIINQGLSNGVISVGKSLTVTQQAAITQITGNALAWREVQLSGYYVTAYITSAVNQSGVTEYTANYLLVYSKDDQIRQVLGRDVLI